MKLSKLITMKILFQSDISPCQPPPPVLHSHNLAAVPGLQPLSYQGDFEFDMVVMVVGTDGNWLDNLDSLTFLVTIMNIVSLFVIISLCLTLCWLLAYAWLFIRCQLKTLRLAIGEDNGDDDNGHDHV